jgi:hypothetical protein
LVRFHEAHFGVYVVGWFVIEERLREVAKSWRGGQNFCVSRFVIACPDLAGEPGVAAGPKPGDHLSTKEFGRGGTPQLEADNIMLGD